MPEKIKTNVTDDELNDLIPHDVHSPQDVDDLLTTIRTQGLSVLESDPRAPWSPLEQKLAKEAEEVEFDPTPGAPEAAGDPGRIYLREMGVSPLLTPKGKWTLPSASSADNSRR